jgi:hypothetical protein
MWPCDGFCASDVIVTLVFLMGLTFICCGQRLHKYLICAMVGAAPYKSNAVDPYSLKGAWFRPLRV